MEIEREGKEVGNEVEILIEVQTNRTHLLSLRSGYSCKTLTFEPSRFLPKLLKDVEKLGGMVEKCCLTNLEEAAARADLVINCSGLGARDLVPDPNIYPIRGQVFRVSGRRPNKST